MDAPEKPDNLYSEDYKFQFIVPPEAPVFEPTREEFKDPLIYISKIRPIAEKHGICKIRPPSEWQPPFAVDVDNFVFTPRIQRLNELDGKTRVKLNFLDKLAKFWELQGSKLKIPKVENKVLDLPTLHRIVQEEGGLESVSLKKKWSKVAAQMGFFTNKNNGSLLKSHYERLLYPYDVFDQNKSQSDSTENISNQTGAAATLTSTGPTGDKEDEDYKPHGIPSRQAVKPEKNQNDRRAKRYSGVICESEPSHRCGEKLSRDENKDNKELRRLQFYGAGPKMAGYNNKRKYADDRPKTKGKGKKLTYDYDPLAKYVCHNCSRGDSEETMLLCDGCDDSYHTFCLMPPLTEVPKGDWRCPKCVEEEVSKPVEAFGFEQAQREYSLQQFGEMADQFKSDYFRLPVHRVPTDTVEKEFWRIVSSIDEDVTVEYGADLHTVDHGSGFPTAHNSPTHEYIKQQKEYIESSWNLNNLPVVQGSVLGHINANISGMKVPWMYVGMCFATFCWHNEDHWSYSINYLHWGEPKTWYGVPGSSAEEFENAMKSAAPELFESQPDLLHQLVTIMNPNVLMDAGVPVFRTDQHAGEFVITFPRAYHAGFNQGYNFAEAVNFAPADWLKMGRECINHYSSLHRYCVFSHDELLCSMCVRSDALDFRTAAAAYQDVTDMVLNEEEMRKTCNKWGIHRAQQMCFELLADDERQCEECKTTCFLSAITCNCSNKLVCLRHYYSLCQTKPEPCKPEEHLLRYRYSLDELIKMKEKLRSKAETFTNWVNTVQYILENNSPQTLDFDGLKALLVEAEENAFPDSELLESLTEVIRKAEKCVVVAQQLDLNRVRTRTRLNQESKNKLTVAELELLDEEIEGLPCKLREGDGVKHLLSNVKQFQKQAKELLTDDFSSDNIDVKSISKCITLATALDIELPELPLLRIKLEQCKWMVEYKALMDKGDQMTADHLRHLIKSGESVTPVYQVEQAIAHLVHLLENVHSWEERAKVCLLNRSPRQSISHLENLLNESDSIKAHLPSKNTIRDNLKKGKEWNNKVHAILNCENDPYIELLDELVRKGRLIVVHLEMLPRLEAQLNSAHLWKDRAARTFLLKNSHQTLMETISPRSEVGVSTFKAKRRSGGTKDAGQSQCVIAGIKLNGSVDPSQVVAAFKKAENNEKELLKNLRSLNLRKRMNNSPETKYCVCKRTAYGFMLECALCRDWFHGSCVPLMKGVNKNNKSLASELKFLCPVCVRSRRPKLETIVSLLVTLQKLAVRLPEGDALQCLTERAMSWQDKARKILSTDEMTTALAKLSVISQQMAVDSSSRQKTDRVMLSEAWKSGGNKVDSNHGMVRVLQPPQSATDPNSSSSSSSSCQKSGSPVICSRMEKPHSSSCSYSPPQGEIQGSYSNSEHAYSSVSKTSSTSKKHLRKSPLVPRVLEEPQFTLSQQGRIRLMDIMIEGDLMEVSLEETQQIWRILEATKRHGPVNNKCQDIEDLLDFPSPVIRRVESLNSDQSNVRRRGNNSAVEQSQVKRTKLAKDTSNTKPSIAPVTDSFQSSNHKGRKQKLICMREDFDENVSENNNKRKMNNNEGEEEQEESSEDDEVDNETSEDDCAAGLCLHPSGTEVDWVQCDGGCEQWFHLLCVNLKKTDINEDEDYICMQCKDECQAKIFLVELTSSGNSMEIESIKDEMETCEPSASTCAANLCSSIWNERNVIDSPMELEDSAKEKVQILSRSDEGHNPDLSDADQGVKKAQTTGSPVTDTQAIEGFSKFCVQEHVTEKSHPVLSTDVDL